MREYLAILLTVGPEAPMPRERISMILWTLAVLSAVMGILLYFFT